MGTLHSLALAACTDFRAAVQVQTKLYSFFSAIAESRLEKFDAIPGAGGPDLELHKNIEDASQRWYTHVQHACCPAAVLGTALHAALLHLRLASQLWHCAAAIRQCCSILHVSLIGGCDCARRLQGTCLVWLYFCNQLHLRSVCSSAPALGVQRPCCRALHRPPSRLRLSAAGACMPSHTQ